MLCLNIIKHQNGVTEIPKINQSYLSYQTSARQTFRIKFSMHYVMYIYEIRKWRTLHMQQILMDENYSQNLQEMKC